MIVKCSHCGKILSRNKFASHKCELPLKKCEIIEVVYFRDDSYADKKVMTGWGIDGIVYTFEVVPRKPIPIMLPLSDGWKHLDESDGKVTEPISRFCEDSVTSSVD